MPTSDSSQGHRFSLHDALPICRERGGDPAARAPRLQARCRGLPRRAGRERADCPRARVARLRGRLRRREEAPPLAEPRRPVCGDRSEEHTSELQSPCNLVCPLLTLRRVTDFPYTTLFRSVGSVEVIPRRVLLVYKHDAVGYLGVQDASVLIAPVLEWLGYAVDYADVKKPLPSQSLAGRYAGIDRKSTRLNSSHLVISYAHF